MASEQQRTVLLVEDDALLSDLLVRKLATRFKPLYAETGEAALNLLKTNTPDLVLLDLMLPGMDGFEVLRQIKADPQMSRIPVVILSNLGQPSDLAKGKELGAEEFVIKVTLTPDEVVNLVDTVCARTGSHAA